MPRSKADAGDGTRKQSQRRTELIHIARELFGEQGYKATTVRDIADRANILSGSLFYHFQTKDSILEEMLQPYLDDVVAKSHHAVDSAETADAALENLIVLNIRIGIDQRAETRIVKNDRRELVKALPSLAKTTKEIDDLWMSVLRTGAADGTFRDDVDLDVVFRRDRGAVLEFVDWYQPKGAKSVDEVIHTYVTMFLAGILADPSSRRWS